MSSNDTSGSSGGDSSSSGVELIVAVVALVISIAAFIISVLQALQQYFSSAKGYSLCSEAIIGKWVAFRKRRFLPFEFRFEVQFEVPVIFVARPSNTAGPLGQDKDKPIVRMDGSPASVEQSYTMSQAEFDAQVAARKANPGQVIHTADNEEATWLALLMAIQRMERDSREWQAEQLGYRYAPPAPVPDPPHSLVVCMQRKKRSWDSMPEDFTKPYATTTISHMVEMTAMLGIYWKEFNRNEDRYRAQGNGFSLMGSYVENFGVVFSFQKTGPTWATENRVVPHYDVKELCFGFSPTVFRAEHDKQYADEPKGKGTLQLGSMVEIAETLSVFGCNTNTINYFRKSTERTRHSHIFPIPFEILGMIGIVFQVERTVFRMLPNPTVFHWESPTSSLLTLLLEYCTLLREHAWDPLLSDNKHISDMLAAANGISKAFSEWSTATAEKNGTTVYSLAKLEALHAAIKLCDAYIKRSEHVTMAQLVFRVHVQEVLDLVNDRDRDQDEREEHAADEQLDERPAVRRQLTQSAVRKHNKKQQQQQHLGDKMDRPASTAAGSAAGTVAELTPVQKLDSTSAESRPYLLASLYVSRVRPRVVDEVCEQLRTERQRSVRRMSDAGTQQPPVLEVGPEPPRPPSHEQLANDMWCTMAFRMMCWLLLHDFHKKDVQISKSEAFENRMPVFIT